MITGEHIYYSINGQQILEDVNFSAEEGEIVTVVGPNGCGKSTMLRILSRLLKADRGEVKLRGRPLSAFPGKELARRLAILPQRKQAPPDTTVEQLVQFGRFPYTGVSGQMRQEDFQAVDDALQETGMDRFRDRTISSLSGGESQMAWITMAIAQTPEILFLDEPTTYLDICYQLEVLELVRKLNRELRLTIVMVLHDINQAAAYSDRIYALKNRQCYCFGKTQEVIREELFRDVFSVETKTYCAEDSSVYMPIKIAR